VKKYWQQTTHEQEILKNASSFSIPYRGKDFYQITVLKFEPEQEEPNAG
jgi:hypothetical protein